MKKNNKYANRGLWCLGIGVSLFVIAFWNDWNIWCISLSSVILFFGLLCFVIFVPEERKKEVGNKVIEVVEIIDENSKPKQLNINNTSVK